VLIPTSDHDVLAVAALPGDLAERFPSSQASAPLLRQLLDKDRLRQLLDAHGVPRPRTIPVEGVEDLELLDDEGLADLFIKPRDSQEFNRRLRVKGLRPAGREELRAALARVQAEGLAVVLQEYIPGPPTNHYFLDGFVDRAGRVRARMARRRLRMSEPNFGNSCATVSVPIRDVAPAAADLERLFAATGFRGPYDAEFKLDGRTGVFHLLEINVRPWWQVEFAALCGVDVVGMAYRDALGLPVADVGDYAIGIDWVLPYHDVAACWRMISAGEMTVSECVRSLATARWGGFASDDPLPGIVEGAALLRRVATRGARRALMFRRETGSEPPRPRVPSG
jgi:predicted ATP-grasp superfamily ATP-dependent carboligase